ncbi:MAG: hypothetical protein CMQ41_13465 [Gammaproteobacteria bacterium]|nr:hypothetical protein [Gammaproteobacteria bacterium]|tara:strand:+ start:118 stop:636 length:519 start_codon:yes stop_codon:yes gene_type:complete
MNWEALGAIGEIIGAAAVLATLFYLAAQIKTQNRQLEKSNENVTAQLSIDINNMLINNSDVLMRDNKFARIYQKGMSNQLLDEVEKLQFSQFINRWVALAESVIVVAKAELMFAGDYDLDFLYGNPYMHKLLKTEVGERWFKEEAPLLYSEDYLMKVASFKNSMESDLTLEE